MNTIACLLAAALAAGSAPRKIAVLDIESTGVTGEQAEAIALLIPTEVRKANPGARVISGADIRAVIGLERQKMVMGCTADASCVAEIGGALGVDELVNGKLAKLSHTYVLELRRIDVRKAMAIASVTRTAKAGDDEAFLAAVQSAVTELFATPNAAGSPTAVASAAPPPAVAPAPTARTSLPAPAAPSKALAWTSTIAGGVLLAGGLAGAGWSWSVASAYDAQQSGGSATVTRAKAATVKTVYPVSLGAAGLGAAALGFGIYQFLRAPGAPSGGAHAMLAPARGGAFLVFEGGF